MCATILCRLPLMCLAPINRVLCCPHSQGVISLFMERAKSDGAKDVTVLGDGQQTRDFVYVKDIARAIVTAMKSKR